jgi:hypothetical protein
MRDTVRVVAGTLAAVWMVIGSIAGAEESSALNAKVIWVHGGRAYVASNETLPIQTGDLLTFYDGKKMAGAGKVSSVMDGTLDVARMKSGYLDQVKKLDKLRIMAERPKLRPVDALRIGIPSRSSTLFACGTPSVKSPLPRAAFSGEAMSSRSFILARDKSDPSTAQWPDTLYVRLFDESTDEEIGLERGELDVAVFWPGELSTHMREDPKWKDFAYGTRPRSILFATLSRDAEGGFMAADSTALFSLNSDLFRGDLMPWDAAAGHPSEAHAFSDRPPSHRFEVDRGVPGWQALERALQKKTGISAAAASSYSVKIALLGAQATPADPVGMSFAIRCPVVSEPSLREYVKSLGPDALANMVDCAISGGRR